MRLWNTQNIFIASFSLFILMDGRYDGVMMIINLRCLVDDEIILFYLQKRLSLALESPCRRRHPRLFAHWSLVSVYQRERYQSGKISLECRPVLRGTEHEILCAVFEMLCISLKTCTTRFNRIRAFCEAVFVHELWPLVNNLSHDDGRWVLVSRSHSEECWWISE